MSMKNPASFSLTKNLSLYYKTFYGCNCCRIINALVFVTAIHFHHSLLFVGKARSLPLEWSKVRAPQISS